MNQGIAAAAALGQQAHQDPVGVFVPGFQRQPLASELLGRLVTALPGMALNQAFEGQGHAPAVALPAQQEPILEVRAAGYGEVLEKRPAIKVDGLPTVVALLSFGRIGI